MKPDRQRAMRVLIILSLLVCSSHAAKKPNILFIAIDDMRADFGCYGSELAITPNLDKLAGRGVLFNRAYCQQAICGPSRASIMTGARPDSIGVTHNYLHFRELNPKIVTLPQHFIAQGYEAAYCGKIYHQGKGDDALSWSRQPATKNVGVPKPKLPGGYALPENQKILKANKAAMVAKYGQKTTRGGLGTGPAYECADVPDHAYIDGYNTQLAIATMKEMAADKDKPFFLALGFKKPHLNWIAPKKYWDLYDRNKIPLTTQTNAPEGGAEMGIHASFELRTRHGIPKTGPIGPELSRTLKHAYLACTSYVDAQIGKMIAAVDSAGIRENTIIVIWSDHGWHLGEMGIWGKATNYELAARVPLIIWAPNIPVRAQGSKSNALVELVDIYPTLCDLAGTPTPKHLDGISLKPLLSKPDLPWKKAAFTQFPNPALREWGAYPLKPAMRETYFGPLIKQVEKRIIAQQKMKWDRQTFEHDLMGYAMRTDRYRFVAWKNTKKPDAKPLFVELYDHTKDPHETKNIAEQNPETVKDLLEQLKSGWKGNLPASR